MLNIHFCLDLNCKKKFKNNCYRVVGNNFQSDALGPSTIVGSAAFNLLAISAVCIVAIPQDEGRR